ncbi:MAG TPA: hypothetical protein VLD15_07380, partial [Burkholderiales bacterium]|nr:hypothetical protein [Burkholderiales bacterium]
DSVLTFEIDTARFSDVAGLANLKQWLDRRREAFLGDAASGVYVRPRVAGDRVTVDVSAQRESLSSQPHRGVNVQGVVTTVSGRLGEWIEIGGIGRETRAERSELLGRSSATAREARRMLIKVEEMR